jgi:protein-S-isoprenylcysteine O-methyltransferase Ste14
VIWQILARRRVPLGFLCAAGAFVLARPVPAWLAAGVALMTAGETFRIWASGHIDKGREVTRSGPYRFVRHPLYLGSAVMGAGFIVAAHSWWVALIATVYVGLTYVAAMRTEEAALEARFGGEYAAYRAGQAAPVVRAFSWSRVVSNREYRSMAGLLLAIGILWWKL